MTTHIGKIARLSKRRRDDIGRRLENGLAGGDILKWLNKLKDVKAVLRTQFGGRRINKQNLSAWRRSGYVEWLAQEGQRRSLRGAAEDLEGLAKTVGKRSLGNGLAILLALEMHELTETLLKQETDPVKRWERVRELHREVSRLRRDDDRVKRTSLREKALEVQSPRSKVQSSKQLTADWEEPAQGCGAAGQEESRQVKAGEEPEWVENIPPTEGPPTQVVARRPSRPGYEYVKIYEKGTGFWFKEVPAGWEPVGWKSSIMLERMGNEEQGLEVQSPGTEGDEGRGMNEVQNPMSKAQSLNGQAEAAVVEAEARPAVPVNPQAGKPALPYVPNPDPAQEAYIQWWLMNRNFKPFDHEELQRLYAAIPKEEVQGPQSNAQKFRRAEPAKAGE